MYFTIFPQYLLFLWRDTFFFLSNHNKSHSYSRTQLRFEQPECSGLLLHKACISLSFGIHHLLMWLRYEHIFSTCYIAGNEWRQQTFAAEGQIVNSLSSASHMIFLIPLRLCSYLIKSAKGNMQMKGRGCVPIKFY